MTLYTDIQSYGPQARFARTAATTQKKLPAATPPATLAARLSASLTQPAMTRKRKPQAPQPGPQVS